MSTNELTLVIDVGGQSIRCILINSNCQIIFSKYLPYSVLVKNSRFIEHNPSEMKKIILILLKRAKKEAKYNQYPICNFALTVQRSTFLCLDKQTFRPLSPVISWQDTRGADLLLQLKIDNQLIRHKTGLIQNSHYGASKFLWCLQNYNLVKSAKDKDRLIIVPLSSYLSHLIDEQNEFRVDPGIAARTMLFNYRDLCWDEILLDLFGVSKNLMVQIYENNKVIERVETIEEVNNTLVIGDQNTVLFSIANSSKNSLFLNLGSGGFLMQATKDNKDQKTGMPNYLQCLLYVKGGIKYYAKEATINGVANAIRWFQSFHKLKVIKSYTQVAKEKNKIMFLNSVGGLGAPYWRSDIEPELIGKSGIDSELKAVYESILFLIKINVDLFNADASLNRIILSGGMANDSLFNQSIADLCNVAVVYTRHYEATAYGAFNLLTDFSHAKSLETWTEVMPRENRELLIRYSLWIEMMESRLNND